MKLQITFTLEDDDTLDIDYNNPEEVNTWEIIGMLEWAKQLLITDYLAEAAGYVEKE